LFSIAQKYLPRNKKIIYKKKNSFHSKDAGKFLFRKAKKIQSNTAI